MTLVFEPNRNQIVRNRKFRCYEKELLVKIRLGFYKKNKIECLGFLKICFNAK